MENIKYTRQIHEANENMFESIMLYGLELALVWGTVIAGAHEFNKLDKLKAEYEKSTTAIEIMAGDYS